MSVYFDYFDCNGVQPGKFRTRTFLNEEKIELYRFYRKYVTYKIDNIPRNTIKRRDDDLCWLCPRENQCKWKSKSKFSFFTHLRKLEEELQKQLVFQVGERQKKARPRINPHIDEKKPVNLTVKISNQINNQLNPIKNHLNPINNHLNLINNHLNQLNEYSNQVNNDLNRLNNRPSDRPSDRTSNHTINDSHLKKKIEPDTTIPLNIEIEKQSINNDNASQSSEQELNEINMIGDQLVDCPSDQNMKSTTTQNMEPTSQEKPFQLTDESKLAFVEHSCYRIVVEPTTFNFEKISDTDLMDSNESSTKEKLNNEIDEYLNNVDEQNSDKLDNQQDVLDREFNHFIDDDSSTQTSDLDSIDTVKFDTIKFEEKISDTQSTVTMDEELTSIELDNHSQLDNVNQLELSLSESMASLDIQQNTRSTRHQQNNSSNTPNSLLEEMPILNSRSPMDVLFKKILPRSFD